MSAISMIATHMNAPYGAVVTEDDVAQSFAAGRFCAATSEANEILCAMFIECDKALIERAARELGVSPETLNALYADSLERGVHAVPWQTKEP